MMRSLNNFDRAINDLVTSAQTDVLPILQPNRPEGGYFGVPRMVFCYVDFLGLLFCGWVNKKDKKGVKEDFATGPKAKKFIKEIFGKIYHLYEVHGDLLYDMYRHGTVHIYSPKKMISSKFPNRTIEWLLYKGERDSWGYYENKATKFRHLKIIEWSKDRFILPVSINVLYSDLIEAIVLYRQMVHDDNSKKLLKKFSEVANALDSDFDSTSHKFWK